ncbi:MAG: class I SAM-dependent methyltransferase [Solirubrobacteraceae bacterium]
MSSRLRDLASRLRRAAENLPAAVEGYRYAARLPFPSILPPPRPADAPTNPLEAYFDAHCEGPGLWKWRHYFEIYDRHFAKFVGREVHIVEIGIFSGGSLAMWQNYFGERCHIYGVDIEDACRVYEADNVRVFIGDQADRGFWRRFVEQVPRIDIVVDDGGHLARQQIVTLRSLLPHIAPGGVYLCEDIHLSSHPFHAFIDGVTRRLNAIGSDPAPALSIHHQIASVHHYPLVTVIEKPERPVPDFESPRHGTEWQPFEWFRG